MSVVSVALWKSWQPKAKSTGDRSYISQFKVLTNDVNDGPITCRDANGVPRVNSPYEWGNDFDNGAFASEYDVQYWDQDKSRLMRIVTVLYTTRSERRNDDYTDDPVDQPAKISGGGQRFSKNASEDKDGNAIVTSADELITDVRVDDNRDGLRIEKNYNTIDPAELRAHSNSLNEGPFFGLPALSWKMDPPIWEQLFRGNKTPYYRVIWQFQADTSEAGNWNLRLADRGTYYLDANGDATRFKANGIVIPKGNLDGTGGQLVQGAGLVFLDIQYYTPRDWSLLDIPQDL